MPLKPIFINGRFFTQRITGTQRYAHEMLSLLDSMLVDSPAGWPEITVLVPPLPWPMPAYKKLEIRSVGRFTGRLWEQVELPFYARRGLLFTPCGGAPLLHPRNVINIHDAAVFATPGGYSLSFRLWYQMLYRVLCRTSLHVFTVSQFSKSELVKYCGANPAKVTVTYLGAEHAAKPVADPAVLKEFGLRPFGYVLTAGSRSPNKNLEKLLQAFSLFAELQMDLVLAGAANISVFGGHSTPSSAVVDVGYVSDGALRTLYENAACFAFPSLYEGFGLPPLEAMASGCPTVVSGTGSMAEIFGSVAFLCDPEDPRDIAAKIVQASASSPEYRERCKHFASIFQWQRCARTTWGVIAGLCSETEKVTNLGGESKWRPVHAG